jgi:hypothetical protein
MFPVANFCEGIKNRTADAVPCITIFDSFTFSALLKSGRNLGFARMSQKSESKI